MNNNNTIFDDVFRTMLERMPSLIIPVINEVFQTSYSEDEQIEQYRNEHHTASGEVITDSYLGIRDKFYHVECQSTQDSKMSIRMIEYDFAIALEHAQKNEYGFELNFPHSCVLYLRHDGNTPEHLQVKVNMPDGEQVIYQVPTVKVQEYTCDEIFQKRLLFFLPFYIMRYEKEIKGISKNSSRLEKLVGEYEDIRKQLGNMLVREEKTDLYLRLMGVIKEISNYMLREEELAQKRIGEIMGGKVLELEADRILARVESKRQEVERFSQEVESRSQEVESRSQEVESRSQEVESRSQEVESRSQEVESRSQEVESRSQEVESRSQEVESRSQEVERERQEVERERQELARERQELARERQELEIGVRRRKGVDR